MQISKDNKLIITIPPETREPSEIIRVDAEAARLLNDLYMETGLSVRFLASDMIKYAYQNIEIKKRRK